MNRLVDLFNINFVLILLFLLTFFSNKISNKGIFFGIRFPREYLNEQELVDIEKKYKKLSVIVFILIAVAVNIAMLSINIDNSAQMDMFMGIFAVSVIVIMNLLYIPNYIKVKRLKKERGWTYKRKNVVVTDTTLLKPRKDETIKPINSLWFLSLLVVPLCAVILTIYKFDSIPEMLNISGSKVLIDKNSTEGLLFIYRAPITQFFMIIFLYFVNKIALRSRVDLNSGSISEAVERKKKFKRLASIFMFVITLITTIMFLYTQAVLLYNLDIMIFNYVYIIVTGIVMVGFIIGFVKIGHGGLEDGNEDTTDELYKDDDDHWILGDIYFNKKDPAWMVEKRRGIGWTVNMANPKTWIFVVIIIVMIVAGIIKDVIL